MTDAPALTQDTLKRLLHYEPLTGVFTWLTRADVRQSWNTRYAGKEAGFDWSIGNVTYRSIRIFDWPFLAHRLAFLYTTGAWPKDGIDHKDLDGLNNRWANLREATKAQNSANTKAMRNNSSGFKGVSKNHNGRWRATISISGKQRRLGYFDTPEEASAAYHAAAVERSGEFARSE